MRANNDLRPRYAPVTRALRQKEGHGVHVDGGDFASVEGPCVARCRAPWHRFRAAPPCAPSEWWVGAPIADWHQCRVEQVVVSSNCATLSIAFVHHWGPDTETLG